MRNAADVLNGRQRVMLRLAAVGAAVGAGCRDLASWTAFIEGGFKEAVSGPVPKPLSMMDKIIYVSICVPGLSCA